MKPKDGRSANVRRVSVPAGPDFPAAGMTYVIDPYNGRSVFMDPDLSRILLGSDEVWDVMRFRDQLSNAGKRSLDAHMELVTRLDGQAPAHLVLAAPSRDGSGPVWLHFRTRIMKSAGGRRRKKIVGAAVLLSPDQATELRDDLSRQILAAEEDERRRIGRELHDSTIQHLVALGFLVGRLEARHDAADTEVVDQMRKLLTTAQKEMRTFVFLLHPPEMGEQGLEQSLRRFVSGFQRRTGIEVFAEVELGFSPISFDTELALYRIVQEALMNVHRHAQARTVDVSLVVENDTAMLVIQDDGVGMSSRQIVEALKGGDVCISGMRARVLQLGGSLELQSRRRGVCIQVSLPTRSRPA